MSSPAEEPLRQDGAGAGQTWAAPTDTALPSSRPDDLTQRLVRDVVAIVAVYAGVAVLLGFLWSRLVPEVTVTRTELGVGTDEAALVLRFGNDGWFAVLGVVSGLVLGLVLTLWRRTHELVTVIAVSGAALLAAWITSLVGGALGPEDPAVVLDKAPVGSTAPDMIQVTSEAAYYVWPFAALLGALVVLLSPPGQSLVRRRRHGARADAPREDDHAAEDAAEPSRRTPDEQ